MRNRSLIFSTVFVLLVPAHLSAQQPTLTPERQAAMMEAGRMAMMPAAFVLQHRQELSLTETQVSAVEKLAAVLRDSASLRMTRRMSRSQKAPAMKGMTNLMDWGGPIDESAIRKAMREQSEMQADLMIGMARDRRAVAALLTAEQRAKLPQLQMNEMTKAARAGGR